MHWTPQTAVDFTIAVLALAGHLPAVWRLIRRVRLVKATTAPKQ